MVYRHRHSLQYLCYLLRRKNLQEKCWTIDDQVLILEVFPKQLLSMYCMNYFFIVLCFLFNKQSWINLKAAKLKPYVFNFAIKRSWFRLSNALERSVSKVPNTLPLFWDLLGFSNKAKRHCWVLNPFLKPYWYFKNISSKNLTVA